MSKTKRSHATSLTNVAEWLRAVVAAESPTNNDKNNDKVDDDDDGNCRLGRDGEISTQAFLGLQELHTALVREIMKRSVEKLEDDATASGGGGGRKKGSFRDAVRQVVQELGLEEPWEDVWNICEEQHKKEQAQQEKGDNDKKGTKKKSRKRKVQDESLLAEQELLFQQSKELALQQRKDDEK